MLLVAALQLSLDSVIDPEGTQQSPLAALAELPSGMRSNHAKRLEPAQSNCDVFNKRGGKLMGIILRAARDRRQDSDAALQRGRSPMERRIGIDVRFRDRGRDSRRNFYGGRSPPGARAQRVAIKLYGRQSGSAPKIGRSRSSRLR